MYEEWGFTCYFGMKGDTDMKIKKVNFDVFMILEPCYSYQLSYMQDA